MRTAGSWGIHIDTMFRSLRIYNYRLWASGAIVSNVGTWMHDVGAGWPMTSPSASPAWVALMQTATTLPVFLLALPPRCARGYRRPAIRAGHAEWA